MASSEDEDRIQEEEVDSDHESDHESCEEDSKFTSEWDMSDVTLKTDDDSLIYVNKAILCQWSPVFKVMLTGDYKEKNQSVIDLPGKKSEELIKFMAVLHPPPARIDESNVDVILDYAEEYQVPHLQEDCETFLMKSPGVGNLIRAEKYHLEDLEETCISHLQKEHLDTLREDPAYEQLSASSVDQILSYKFTLTDDVIEAMMDEVKYYTGYTRPNDSVIFSVSHSEHCNYKGRVPHPGGVNWFPEGYNSTTYSQPCQCPSCLIEVFNRILTDYKPTADS